MLYRFDDDTAGSKPVATCNDACAKIWLPALTNDGKPKLKGVDAKLVGTVTRADGTQQLTLKGWPLYSYIGDKVAGTLSTYGAEEENGRFIAAVKLDDAAEPALRGGADALNITFAPTAKATGTIRFQRLSLMAE